jgi:O-antigen ligase
MVYVSAALMSLAAGMLVATSQAGAALALLGLAGLAGLAILLSIPATVLFLGWLVLTQIFAGSGNATGVGRTGYIVLYLAPALVLTAITLMRARAASIVSVVEFLPAAYVAYVLVSIAVTSNDLQADPVGTLRFVFLIVALGPVLYYFLTIGPGAAIPRERLVLVLLACAALQGVLALVEFVTHWSLWDFTSWHRSYGIRAVSTLGNPGILGAFLGIGIVFALAALTWGGPRSLRKLSVLTLIVAIPGLFATLTLGPILATALAAIILLLLGQRRLLGVAVIASTVIAVFALMPLIQAQPLYEQRFAVSDTILARSGLQQWSLELAAQKPVFGWGYGSFDRVKNNTSELASISGIPIEYLLNETSHNSFLTMLVEVGALGLLLFALPFVVLTGRAISRARAPTPERWIVAGATASLLVIAVSALTFDFRFFSFPQALPWIVLAILRNAAKPPPTSIT